MMISALPWIRTIYLSRSFKSHTVRRRRSKSPMLEGTVAVPTILKDTRERVCVCVGERERDQSQINNAVNDAGGKCAQSFAMITGTEIDRRACVSTKEHIISRVA